MNYYLFRLIPPRPDFPANISAAEADAMGRHADYWSELLGKGVALVFGPVLDPRGTFGVAVVRLDGGPDAAARLGEGDPAVLAGLGFTCTVHPMPGAVGMPGPAASG